MPLAEFASVLPTSLFIALFGVTFLFGVAKNNGALDHGVNLILQTAVKKTHHLPVLFFILALGTSMVGAGNIGATAILAPLAMTAAGRTGHGAFFMTLMLVNGANAGAFSPLAPTGIIVQQSTSRIGLEMHPWTQVFLPSLLAQSVIALVWYLTLTRGARLKEDVLQDTSKVSLDIRQRWTLAAIPVFFVIVTVFGANVGLTALALGAALIVSGAGRLKETLKAVPWRVIAMVCGVSALIGIIERAGGLEFFTAALARISDPVSITAVLAAVTGLASNFSSSSGVVLPTFIPMVPGILEKIGGGSAAALVASINVGSHVVDVSPFSTLGALCLASAHGDKRKLFRELLVTGLLMTFFGAGVCYLFFGVGGKYFAV